MVLSMFLMINVVHIGMNTSDDLFTNGIQAGQIILAGFEIRCC